MSDREAFEKAVSDLGWSCRYAGDGVYETHTMNFAWKIWQKAIELKQAEGPGIFEEKLHALIASKIELYDSQMEGADHDDFIRNEWAAGAMRQLKKDIAALKPQGKGQPIPVSSALDAIRYQALKRAILRQPGGQYAFAIYMGWIAETFEQGFDEAIDASLKIQAIK